MSGRLFAVLLTISLAISYGVRVRHWIAWDAHPELYDSAGVPASSSDSYAWFRIAREVRDGEYAPGTRDPLRAWPDGVLRGPVPAFPWLIAQASRAFDGDVYRAGIALSVLLSGLFIVPLALYGRGHGVPWAGLLGGFVGTLSPAYLERSSVHRIDTDGGNLFFAFLLAWGLGSLRASEPLRGNLVIAALSGLALAAFCRWYGQPGFWLVYTGTAALALACGGFGWKRALSLGALFAACANPLSLLPGISGLAHFLHYYVMLPTGAAPGPLDYASITRDISELRPIGVARTLAGIVPLPGVAALGLVGFTAFALLRWRSALPLLPVALLGFYALVGPPRFGMYLAPLAGFGLGFALDLLERRSVRRTTVTSGRLPGLAAACLVLGAGALWLLGSRGLAPGPEPSIPRKLVNSLQRLAPKLPPRPAVLLAWPRGYLVMDVTGAATWNDGEAPDPLVHYLYARAISSSDPNELRRIVSVLSRFGRRELHAAVDGQPDPRAALGELLRREVTAADNVVLLVLEQDLHAFDRMFRAGRWRFEQGQGPLDGFDARDCEPTSPQRLRCTKADTPDLEVDLATGRLDGHPLLRRALELRDGAVAKQTEYAPGAPISIELVPGDRVGAFRAYLVSERVFRSNFNQLWLGRFDPTFLEPIHDDFPVARAWRVRGEPVR